MALSIPTPGKEIELCKNRLRSFPTVKRKQRHCNFSHLATVGQKRIMFILLTTMMVRNATTIR